MKTPTLSKSDYKLARNCLKKLWYKKQGYASSAEGDEYMDMLADGGFMVGKMAQLLYPGGIEITGTGEEAIQETRNLLKQKDVILFEPAILSDQKLIRIDILVKQGQKMTLIEVKSKSFNASEAREPGYFEKAGWREYIEDIAYQKWVLHEAYPDCAITCELLMPDKDKTTPIDGLISWFSIEKQENTGRFKRNTVHFSGDLEALQKGHILSWVNVDDTVELYLPEVKASAQSFLSALNKNKAAAFQTPLSIACKGCEYQLEEPITPNGFTECWGKLAKPKPHILDLGRIGNVNRRSEYKDCINTLIEKGKTALSDVPIDYVRYDNGKPYYNNRVLYQLSENKEFLLPGFKEAIQNQSYPLHFIDFETSQMAIPYHQGMRPYGKVLFQWSCHTVHAPGAEPVHSEWINTVETYPNRAFAHSLMAQLGDAGSIMTWSAYENTQLKDLVADLEAQAKLDQDEKALLKWLKTAVKAHADDDTRICDMNQLALHYYFHPLMGGRTSIKVTLPAVLSATKSKKIKKWLADEGLWHLDSAGIPEDPYKHLPSIDIMNKAEKIKDGSGAMRAYQDMLYGLHKNDPETKAKYRDALLKYCKLDTLAMVVIWERWREMNN